MSTFPTTSLSSWKIISPSFCPCFTSPVTAGRQGDHALYLLLLCPQARNIHVGRDHAFYLPVPAVRERDLFLDLLTLLRNVHHGILREILLQLLHGKAVPRLCRGAPHHHGDEPQISLLCRGRHVVARAPVKARLQPVHFRHPGKKLVVVIEYEGPVPEFARLCRRPLDDLRVLQDLPRKERHIVSRR